MNNWIKLTAPDGAPCAVNLSRAFVIVPAKDGGCTIYSGDIAAATVPKVKSGDSGYAQLPCSAAVRESMDEVLGLLSRSYN